MAQDEKAPSEDLATFLSDVVGHGVVRVEESFGDGFVRLRVDEAERRQAKHDIRQVEDAVVEMLRNARDADASHIYVATGKSDELRTLTIVDDGQGVPASMTERIFDARVTSKLDSIHTDRWGVHGRGMALFSIRENAQEARVVASVPHGGSSIRVVMDLDHIPERRDQSTWPTLGMDDEGETRALRGPHNIVRTCCEFALEERGICDVYLGSDAEMLATMRSHWDQDGFDHLFVDDIERLGVVERVAVAADARELLEAARSIGLEVSERTAHRILAGAVRPQRSVAARLTHRSDGTAKGCPIDLDRDRRGLRLTREDAEELSRTMERAFEPLAERYYLTLSDQPRVRVSKDRITVTFPIDKGEEG